MELRYVQGDSRPAIRVSLELAGAPIDVSAGGTTVRAYIRLVGQTTLKDTLVGTKSTGRLTAVDSDTGAWTVDTTAPYNVAGVGGIVLFNPNPTTFNQAGQYEAEYEIDLGGGIKQTVNKVDRINVRAQIG
jgi:hypothetical protein